VDGRPDRGGFASYGMGRGPRLSWVPPSGRGRSLGGAGVSAPLLGSAWPTLDHFEGAGYERIFLVAVFGTELGPGQAGERRLHTVANLYTPTEAERGDSEASQDS
jgi:hypothetical protein